MRIWAIAGIAAALCVSSAASAAEFVTFHYKGQLEQWQDFTGVFGPADAVPGTADFTAQLTFRLDQGTRVTSPTSDEVFSDAVSSPFVDAAITINSVTYTFNDPTFASARFDALNGEVATSLQFADLSTTGVVTSFGLILHNVFLPDVPSLLSTPYVMGPAGIDPTSSFFVSQFDFDTSTYLQLAAGVALPDELYTTVTQGVPEPTTWALMILGFGAAGAMLRRRRLVPN